MPDEPEESRPAEDSSAAAPTRAEDEELERYRQLETAEADVEAPPQPVVRRGGTFESFRNPDFTWFWFGALVSNVGTWMQNYAIGIVVYAVRSSQVDLGVITFISGIPVLFLAIPGGALADRVNRRKLLIWIQVPLLLQAAALGFLYNAGKLSSSDALAALAWLAFLGVVAGVFSALQFPAWQAMLPDLVPRESLLNGIALNSAQFQSSRLIGPALASALVVAGAGMGEIFYVNAASFLFVIAALWIIRLRYATPKPPQSAGAARPGTRETLLGGLRYARRDDRTVGLLILSTAVMTFFGFAYVILLPAIVNKTLGLTVDSQPYKTLVGVIMAANGLGAMAGALSVASLPNTVPKNRIIPFTLLAFGVALVAFGFSRSTVPVVLFSALAGAAFMTTQSLGNTSIQSTVPPQLRGRVMGLFVMAFLGIMPIAGLVFGFIGQYIGPSNAVLIGSAVVVAWALYLLFSRVLERKQPAAAPAA